MENLVNVFLYVSGTAIFVFIVIVVEKYMNKKKEEANEEDTIEIDSTEASEESLAFEKQTSVISEPEDAHDEEMPQEQMAIIEERKEHFIDYIAKGRAGYILHNNNQIDMLHLDPMFEDAARWIVTNQCGSTALIQRKFSIGYNRARRLMDQLENTGVVGAAMGSKPREVLIQDEGFLENLITALDSAEYTCQILSTHLIDRYSLDENKINIRVNYYLELKKKEEQERERLWIEEEKERLKQVILDKRKKREIKKIALEELRKEGLIENTKKREPIPQDVQDAVWRRDEGRCVKCGSQENLEFDHIIPFSKGGSNTVRNLQLLCEKCNRSKSNQIG